MPMQIASTSARQRCTSRRLSSPEIHFESPVWVATLPSRLIADLKITCGRPVRACLRNGWFSRRAACEMSPSTLTTSMPSSRRMPEPAAGGLLGRIVGGDHDHAAMPARTIASVHGGVWPVWQQGSSVTYIVAPIGSTAQASIAATSACGLAVGGVVALAQHLAVAHDHRADERIGAGVAASCRRARSPFPCGAVRSQSRLPSFCPPEGFPSRSATPLRAVPPRLRKSRILVLCSAFTAAARGPPQPVDDHRRPGPLVGARVVVEAPVEVEARPGPRRAGTDRCGRRRLPRRAELPVVADRVRDLAGRRQARARTASSRSPPSSSRRARRSRSAPGAVCARSPRRRTTRPLPPGSGRPCCRAVCGRSGT